MSKKWLFIKCIIVMTAIISLLAIPGAALANGSLPGHWATEALFIKTGPNPSGYNDLTQIGLVTLSDDGSNLTVVIETYDGWVMTDTHVAAAWDCSLIPQNKKGNPVPGRFSSKQDHGAGTTSCTHVIPAGDVPGTPGGQLCILVHAAVEKDGRDETAWGDCTPFPNARKWCKYIPYPR